MKHSFTQNHLVKFIYRETSVVDTMAINEVLDQDYALYESYNELKKAHRQLPKVTFNPSENAIQNILKYSRETAVETQH